MPSPKVIAGFPVENILIPGQDGQTKIRLRIHKPESVSVRTPVLIWMHGGGYLIGQPEQDDASCAQYVHELGITVISVDYRLAPKHPFPAALDDCHSALTWVVSHSRELNVDPNRIAIGGNSAGSGLGGCPCSTCP